MTLPARTHLARTAALMFATTVSAYGEATPPCERAANDVGIDRDPPPRPAAAAGRPRALQQLRLAA
jgi:hypothetical protein